MKEGRIIDPEKIHILSIKTLKGRIENISETDSSLIAGYTFVNQSATALSLEHKIVGVKLTVYIDTIDKHQKKLDIKGSYTHEFIFSVDNLEDFVDTDQESEGVEITDPILLATLIGISYSTLRGIIITRTQGTALNAVILPVIDPKKLGVTIEEEAENDKT